VTELYSRINTGYVSNYVRPPGAPACGANGCFIADGVDFYTAVMHPYNVSSALNNFKNAGPITENSQYGHPFSYQLARNIRLGLKFTF
jgi:hypothetical protein